jgi:hypothetical protein
MRERPHFEPFRQVFFWIRLTITRLAAPARDIVVSDRALRLRQSRERADGPQSLPVYTVSAAAPDR